MERTSYISMRWCWLLLLSEQLAWLDFYSLMASYKWKLTMIHPVYKHYSILMSLKVHVKTKMLYLLYYNWPGLEYNSININTILHIYHNLIWYCSVLTNYWLTVKSWPVKSKQTGVMWPYFNKPVCMVWLQVLHYRYSQPKWLLWRLHYLSDNQDKSPMDFRKTFLSLLILG
jgi:hypothetical protein